MLFARRIKIISFHIAILNRHTLITKSLIRYAQKNGVTAAAIRYRTYRQYVYRWMKRYDGTLQSLDHRPHNHPNKYTKFPMRPLNWRSPKQVLSTFPDV